MPNSLFVETTSPHVAEVVLRTPGKGNALGPDFWRELPEVFASLDADADVRAVVLRAGGPHFTYGLDLVSMAGELGPLAGGGLADSRTKLHEMVLRLQASVSAIVRCRKPVIAAVHGACIGGGVDVITACDVRIASGDARFSVREVRVAMVADLGTLQRLSRIVGEGRARELAFRGNDIDAEHALRIGLVNEVHLSHEATWDAARTMAREIAGNPPLVVQGVKQVMNERILASDEAGLRYVATWNSAFLPSADLGEAMAAFAEKRKPSYSGR
jgi:enoyl-CoA hydratase